MSVLHVLSFFFFLVSCTGCWLVVICLDCSFHFQFVFLPSSLFANFILVPIFDAILRFDDLGWFKTLICWYSHMRVCSFLLMVLLLLLARIAFFRWCLMVLFCFNFSWSFQFIALHLYFLPFILFWLFFYLGSRHIHLLRKVVVLEQYVIL